jgi:hypothetical protein
MMLTYGIKFTITMIFMRNIRNYDKIILYYRNNMLLHY